MPNLYKSTIHLSSPHQLHNSLSEMFTSQDMPDLFSSSISIDIDSDRHWQDWINLDACTPDDDFPGEDNSQQSDALDFQDPNYDVPPLTLGCPEDWGTFTAIFEELEASASSPSSSSSSLSLSPSPSTSPGSTPLVHFARHFDAGDLHLVDTTNPAEQWPSLPPPLVDAPYPNIDLPQAPPLPISSPKTSRSGKRPSPRPPTKRTAPYKVPPTPRSSPDLCAYRSSSSPRRSLRTRSSCTYRDSSPEDDDDSPGRSNDDVDFVSKPKRGARSSHGDALLHEILTDTSIISCPLCGKEFSRHADVVRHYRHVHLVQSDAEILNDTSSKRLHCLGCTKILSRKDSRERHEATCTYYCEKHGTPSNPILSAIARTAAAEKRQRARL